MKAINKYNNLDRKLRNIKSNSVVDFYCNSLLDFTHKDKILLEWIVNITKEKTPPKLRFMYHNIKFGKYEKT